MCIDQETSFNSYTLATVISVVLITRNVGNDTWNAYFILCFSTIQLLEYFIWKSINDKDPVSNSYYTRLVPIVLFLQPLIQTIGAYYMNKGSVVLEYASYIFITLLLIQLIDLDAFTYTSQPGEHKHLVWYKTDISSGKRDFVMNNHFYGTLYLIGLFFGLFFMKNNLQKMLLLGYGILSYSIIRNKYPTNEFSSMWCIVSVGYSVIALLS